MTFNLSGTDWATWFYPLSRHPLSLSGGHYPPWTYLFVHPFTLFPLGASYLLLTLVSLLILKTYLGSPLKTFLLALSLPVMISLGLGNLDSLLTLAFLLPPSLSLLVIVCKPQALLVWWGRRWLYDGLKARTFLPLLGVILVSLLVWPGWPSRLGGGALATNFLISQSWPVSVLVGLPLLMSRNPIGWVIGGVLVIPYLQVYHLTPVLAFLYKRCSVWRALAITVMSWVIGVAIWG